ncbi:unnamed protein product, partial [Meganyctiphanes norvegica]
MLSPKMQRTIRINENQVLMLAEKARHDHNYIGYLYKRSSDSNKWQLRWFTLYQNLLFYSDGESSVKPSGVIMLEGCYCERLITNTNSKTKDTDKQFCFAITYRRENQRQYDLKAETECDCKAWIDVIRQASFNKLRLQKEELEQKHLHLLQIVESEKTAKWQYTQQCEELTSEIKKLRNELCTLKKEWRVVPSKGRLEDLPEDSDEIKKVKKVQSFFRGWLCRRRWKQIVEEYIRSPHAESMRKRNSLVFRMVETEEEYVEQLNLLVSCFLRPFKMAASSKKPPCSHEDVNSIFLNSETLLFLHQIFLKGLSARMESWPTLVLGDLFDMLLPMLSIYQEYVRNHHYSLQVLAECKQNPHFSAFLNRLEIKPNLQGRTLETFLTYPMHQIPRYIITLHELLAHTPHNHVERKSLDHARMQLEDLSRQMHDEVSETENIRKNLAIERMIVEGCDILLDVNQMFVRQGKKTSLSSCFPKDAVPSFPRRSIDFPRKNTDLLSSEDSEDVGATPRSQRSHSTISYMSREQQLAAVGTRRRLSSLRQSSLGSAGCNAGSAIVRQTLSLGASPLSPPQQTIDGNRRASDVPRIRKKSVRISDESFDECEELAVSGSGSNVKENCVENVNQTTSSTPESSPEDDGDINARKLDKKPLGVSHSGLTPVEERNSLDSSGGEDCR